MPDTVAIIRDTWCNIRVKVGSYMGIATPFTLFAVAGMTVTEAFTLGFV